MISSFTTTTTIIVYTLFIHAPFLLTASSLALPFNRAGLPPRADLPAANLAAAVPLPCSDYPDLIIHLSLPLAAPVLTHDQYMLVNTLAANLASYSGDLTFPVSAPADYGVATLGPARNPDPPPPPIPMARAAECIDEVFDYLTRHAEQRREADWWVTGAGDPRRVAEGGVRKGGGGGKVELVEFRVAGT